MIYSNLNHLKTSQLKIQGETGCFSVSRYPQLQTYNSSTISQIQHQTSKISFKTNFHIDACIAQLDSQVVIKNLIQHLNLTKNPLMYTHFFA